MYREVESFCKLLTANKVHFDLPTNAEVQIKILSILKLVSFESLAWNDFSERGTQAEAHRKRNLNRQLCSIRESSFKMTRAGGDEDIETRSLKF